MTLDEWSAKVSAALGLDYTDPDLRSTVLDLARDAAHGIARPAAPLTTFLLGVAVGRGSELTVAAQQIRELIDEPATD